jgi:hypothetical protein
MNMIGLRNGIFFLGSSALEAQYGSLKQEVLEKSVSMKATIGNCNSFAYH